MKWLKKFEGFSSDETTQKILAILDARRFTHGVHWEIGKDGKINCDGSVVLTSWVEQFGDTVHELPVQFGEVKGDFVINLPKKRAADVKSFLSNLGKPAVKKGLKTLKGCPTSVGGDFDCSGNGLTNLEFSPQSVDGDFTCEQSSITSLKGITQNIGGGLYCSNNELEGDLVLLPKTIGGDINLSSNQLSSLKGSPKYCQGSFDVSHNETLKTLEHCPESIAEDFSCVVTSLETLKWAPKHIGGEIFFWYSKNDYIGHFFEKNKFYGMGLSYDDSEDTGEDHEVNVFLKWLWANQADYKVWKDENTINIERFKMLVQDGLDEGEIKKKYLFPEEKK